jgi:hypothetical protein
MKIIAFTLLLFFGLLPIIRSQTVDSIKIEPTGDLIKIHYKILNSNAYQLFRVTVSCSINGGLKSELKSLSGDFGDNVVGGRSEYMVLWDVLKDVDEVKSVDFSVKAELLKDNSPKIINGVQQNLANKKTYVLFSFGEGNGAYFGYRLAYMGSWGVSGKMLFGKEHLQSVSGGVDVFHAGLDLTRRIINKGGFQLNLLAGFNYGKLLVYTGNGNGYWDKFATYEAGFVLGIKRFAISLAITPYNPTTAHPFWRKDYANFGIGMRF